MSVEVCPPMTRLAAHRPFGRKVGEQTEKFAMRSTHQKVNHLRQPHVLPFSASERC